jgi:GT2 family glycosyltransferase
MVVRSAVFHALGGFDGSFFAHMEEIDFCWRAQRAGYKIMAEPAAVVYHIGGGTLPVNNPKKNYLNFRNSLAMLTKNEAVTTLIWLLPLRLVLDGVAGVRFLLSGQFIDIQMIVRAHWYFFAHFFAILQQREKETQYIKKSTIAAPRRNGRWNKSVLWAFFVQGKRRFSDL